MHDVCCVAGSWGGDAPLLPAKHCHVHISPPFVPCQAPWDDLELGRLIRDDAGGRTYRATFQGACVTAKVCRLHALRL